MPKEGLQAKLSRLGVSHKKAAGWFATGEDQIAQWCNGECPQRILAMVDTIEDQKSRHDAMQLEANG